MKVAVSGASGYMGARIVDFFRNQGCEVYNLGRRSPPGSSAALIPYDMRRPIDPKVLEGLDVVIHAAYNFSLTSRSEIWNENVKGSIALLEAAVTAGVRKIIFVSSISSYAGCRSNYGKAKGEIEAWCEGKNIAIVRPGLVFGGRPGGLFGSIMKVVSRTTWIPMIGDGRYPQYLVHVDDLCRLYFDLSTNALALNPGPIYAAFPKIVLFKTVIQTVASSMKKNIRIVPVPSSLVYIGIRILETIGLRIPFRSDSVTSLLNQNPNPDFSAQPALANYFREFKDSTIL